MLQVKGLFIERLYLQLYVRVKYLSSFGQFGGNRRIIRVVADYFTVGLTFEISERPAISRNESDGNRAWPTFPRSSPGFAMLCTVVGAFANTGCNVTLRARNVSCKFTFLLAVWFSLLSLEAEAGRCTRTERRSAADTASYTGNGRGR